MGEFTRFPSSNLRTSVFDPLQNSDFTWKSLTATTVGLAIVATGYLSINKVCKNSIIPASFVLPEALLGDAISETKVAGRAWTIDHLPLTNGGMYP